MHVGYLFDNTLTTRDETPLAFRRCKRTTNESCLAIAQDRFQHCDVCRGSVGLKSPKLLKIILKMLSRGLLSETSTSIENSEKNSVKVCVFFLFWVDTC